MMVFYKYNIFICYNNIVFIFVSEIWNIDKDKLNFI